MLRRKDVLTAIGTAAIIALNGGGGVREADALSVLRASFAATDGGLFAKLRAARLMKRWCRRYTGGW